MKGDSYTGQYGEDEKFPCHYDIDQETECFGELIECYDSKQGFPARVYYICEECGEEFSASEVLNNDRDSSDWEYDYEPTC